MNPRAKATLRAAEMLRSMGGTSGSPLKALMAFFEPILVDLKGRRFDAALFAARVREAYGWNFNEEVAEGFRESLTRLGWLTPQRTPLGSVVHDSQGAFHVVTPKPESIVDEPDSGTIDSQIDRIVGCFRDFVASIGISGSDYERSDDHIAALIIDRLLDLEDNIEEGERSRAGEAAKPRSKLVEDQDSYLVARFVQDASSRNSEIATDLQWLASVGLLAELADDFRKPSSRVKRTRLTIFLDSPVALDLLGTSGKQAAGLARSVVSRLQQIGATVTLFDQSVRELQNTLKAILYADPFERYGPTQEALMAGETDEAFLHAVVTDAETVFKPHQIKTRQRGSDRQIKGETFFKDSLLSELHAQLVASYDDPGDHEALCQHDANAAAFVMRLRQGNLHNDLFESGSIFLTRNRFFTTLVRNFCIRKELIDSSCVGPFVNMHDLASSLWLRTGMSAEDDIPRRQLLAGCERVLTRNRSVVTEAKRAILSLKRSGLDEERIRRAEAILSQDRAMLLISDRVRGAVRPLTSEDVTRIVDDYVETERQAGIAIGMSSAQAQYEALQAKAKAEAEKARDLESKLGEVETSNRAAIEQALNEAAALKSRLDEVDEARVRRIRALLDEVNRGLSARRRLAGFALLAIAFLIFVTGAWKEVALAKGAYQWGGLFRRFSAEPVLLVCGLVPLVAILVDNGLRALGHERPIDGLLLERWARRRFTERAAERGLADHPAIADNELLYAEGRLSLTGRDFS